MFNKSLIAIATATIALVVVSSAAGQPGRKRIKAKPSSGIITETGLPVKAKTNPPHSNNTHPQNWHSPDLDAESTPMSLKAKKPGFTGGGEDGQSIRRKQPRHLNSKQSNATQINPNQAALTNGVKAKKPSPFSGGTDDGQSIRRKQPRGGLSQQSSAGQNTANPAAMNMQDLQIGQAVGAKPKPRPKARH